MRTHEDPTAKALRVWNKLAPRYDREIRFWERIQLGGGREWIGRNAHGRVLEVAIGTGRNLPFYATDVTITGIELSPAMLAIAKQRATDLGMVAELTEGDAQRLPYADDTFDTVVCALALCTIPDPVAAIREMKRVARPGGTLVLLDHIGSSWRPIWAVQRLIEFFTTRSAGEHMTRRHLSHVNEAGFDLVYTQRLKAGTVERIMARKPLTP